MSNKIHKLTSTAMIAIIAFYSTFAGRLAYANDDVCNPKHMAILFFNGVLTTPRQADAAIMEIQRLHGDIGPAGGPITYAVMF